MARGPARKAESPLSAEAAMRLWRDDLNRWFSRRFPAGPTSCQCLAWPAIARGDHVMLSAPTGTGKTLAALMPIWQKLRDEGLPGLRCLYIAPLRALCNDVYARMVEDWREINTVSPLGAHPPSPMGGVFGLRTADVRPSAKRQLLAHPPSLLVTTPESLALLLANPQADQLLSSVRWVVIDEVHALAPNKRGADLALSLERLDDLASAPPQRIGLSATCSPMLSIAGWLGGTHRAVTALAVPDLTPWELAIEDLTGASEARAFLATLLDRLQRLMQRHRTLLVFTNVRSLSERIAWAMRRRLPHLADRLAVHHGSISKEKRLAVERQLKAGQLRMVLSSTSLELGIDVGHIDHVAFVHAPGGAVRLLQRLGRGGHRPDGVRSGTIFVASRLELLEAAATRSAGQDAFLEPVRIPKAPLDVLCQQLVGMAVGQPPPHSASRRAGRGKGGIAAAWRLARRAYPFRDLDLEDFCACLMYLTGGAVGLELPARLRIDQGRLACDPARRDLPQIYRTNSGTIQDEPHRIVRCLNTDGESSSLPPLKNGGTCSPPSTGGKGAVIGAIPDHFADRLLPGDRFLLDGRVFETLAHESNALLVQPSAGVPAFTRWRGGLWNMPPLLAQKTWHLRIRIHHALLESKFAAYALLHEEFQIGKELAQGLIDQIDLQQRVSVVPENGLLVEASALADGEQVLYAFHLPLPAAACEGVARVIGRRLRRPGSPGHFSIEPGPLGFLITLPADVELTPERLRVLLEPAGFQDELAAAIRGSPVLARRFMETAHTGLMLLRQPLSRRQRRVGGSNWGGDKLMNWLRFADGRFPLLLQAEREAVEEHYQAEAAIACLRRFRAQDIQLRWIDAVSPLACEWLPPGGANAASDAGNLDELLLRLGAEHEVFHAAS